MNWFQHRLIHRIIATNDLLTKMNIRLDNLCTFCNLEQKKIEHLFWHCNVINQFGILINQWIFEKKTNYMVNIDKQCSEFQVH